MARARRPPAATVPRQTLPGLTVAHIGAVYPAAAAVRPRQVSTLPLRLNKLGFYRLARAAAPASLHPEMRRRAAAQHARAARHTLLCHMLCAGARARALCMHAAAAVRLTFPRDFVFILRADRARAWRRKAPPSSFTSPRNHPRWYVWSHICCCFSGGSTPPRFKRLAARLRCFSVRFQYRTVGPPGAGLFVHAA